MFKVQRYQYARYHVTDPNQWFQDNNRWDVPEDPNSTGSAKSLQPPYRMFVTQPPGLEPDDEDGTQTAAEQEATATPTPDGPVWSLTSTFVPYKRSNLAAYMSVDSDATSDTYGQLRVINVIDEQQQGPGQVANAVRSDTDVADGAGAVQPLRQHGDLRQPAHRARRRRADVRRADLRLALLHQRGTFPILRYVLVSYRGGVGIGTSLTAALDEARPAPPTPGSEPTGRAHATTRRPSPTGDPSDEPTDEPTDTPTGDATSVDDAAGQGPGRVHGRGPGAPAGRPRRVPAADRHRQGATSSRPSRSTTAAPPSPTARSPSGHSLIWADPPPVP